jgi:hypothetical protein
MRSRVKGLEVGGEALEVMSSSQPKPNGSTAGVQARRKYGRGPLVAAVKVRLACGPVRRQAARQSRSKIEAVATNHSGIRWRGGARVFFSILSVADAGKRISHCWRTMGSWRNRGSTSWDSVSHPRGGRLQGLLAHAVSLSLSVHACEASSPQWLTPAGPGRPRMPELVCRPQIVSSTQRDPVDVEVIRHRARKSRRCPRLERGSTRQLVSRVGWRGEERNTRVPGEQDVHGVLLQPLV